MPPSDLFTARRTARGRRAAGAFLATVAVVVLAGACGSDSDGTTTAPAATGTTTSTPPTPDATPSESPADGPTERPPAFPPGTKAQFAPGPNRSPLVFERVDVGAHDGFDRVVLTFSGDSAPGWAVSYVDRAVRDGSGAAVRLDGDTVLDVYASGVRTVMAKPYRGPRRIEPASGGGIAEVYVVGTFEGTTQVLVGLDGDRRPFRVFALTQPARLVVDIADTADDSSD